jgi:hypothetical protein
MAEMDGVHVVLSLNQDVWQATFGHHLPSAMEDRLTASQMLLRGIGVVEAADLLRMRLDIADVTPEQAREFEAFVDVRRYFLGRPLGSVAARGFLRHLARQWEVFQNTTPSPEGPFAGGILEDKSMPAAGASEILHTAAEDMPPMPSFSTEVDPHQIFDESTSQRARTIAEGLAEPVAALPQEDEPELPMTPPVSAPASEPGAFPAASVATPDAGAFERLREMLGKLRQPVANSENGHPVAGAEVEATAKLASVMTGTTPPPAPESVPASDAGRDTLLGRYEALRLQMSAEAESLPLDFTKLAELIRLAGRRFPLVRLAEHELPGLTGRHVMCWSLQGVDILFGMANFADTSYWRTLSGFVAGKLAASTADAETRSEPVPKIKLVTFKTDREQQSWSILRMSDVFPGIVEPLIDSIHLDQVSVASLYAMQRIIKESESGALEATPAQVMSVLARELDFFWKRVTRV